MENNRDIYIKSSLEGEISKADNAAIALMTGKAEAYKASENGGRRLKIHLVLRNHLLANAMRRLPVNDTLSDNIELYTYTREDLCSMNVLGIRPGAMPILTRERVTYESNRHIHLVIFGASRQAESLAMHTALTSHLPNYCRDNNLRTRITWFADSNDDFRQFQDMYGNLLEHCYRRFVDINDGNIKTQTIPPVHADKQPDFIDIEWEFVTGKSCSHVTRHKLERWCTDEEQILTIAFCYDDNSRNLNEAISQSAVIRKNCYILTKTDESTTIDYLRSSKEYSNIIPFGCLEKENEELGDYTLMAQYINFAYSKIRATTKEERGHGAAEIAVAMEIPTQDEIETVWNSSRLTTAKRWSNIYNALTLNIKMQSMGIPAERWSTLFGINDRDAGIMTQVEHNRWCIEELILGYTPTTTEQHEAIKSNPALRDILKSELIHDDLRHFSELGTDGSGLSVTRYDLGLTRTLPLIAYTYYTSKSKER